MMTVTITLFRFHEVPTFHDSDDSAYMDSPEGRQKLESIHLDDTVFALGVRVTSNNRYEKKLLQIFVRPRDFEQARDWVLDTDTIKKEDKPALLDVLNAMEDDDNLYIYFSW